MQERQSRLLTLLLLFIASFALPLTAARKAPTTAGTYENWGPDIDQLEIVRTFDASDYSRIAIEPLDVESTPPPEEADMAEKVSKVLAVATEPFAEGVKDGESGLTVATSKSEKPAGTLLVRGRITLMDPGSRAKRMWVGYGAGAARTAISGEIVDAKSGDVLVRFTQERRSGIERFGRGSSYEEIMKRNLHAIGVDVAKIVKEF